MTSDDAQSAHYVAVIMDGNARWAKANDLSVLKGHREGVRALKRTVELAPELGIEELVVYAFSTENWSRPKYEVDGLMALFEEMIESETPELNKQGVKLRYIGSRTGVNPDLVKMMEWSESTTEQNEKLKLFIAFNYGSRVEIEEASRKYAEAMQKNVIDEQSEVDISNFLYCPEMHDPDLLIRTSGEKRVSNFLLWQCAYSEFHFTDVLWPDFSRDDLEQALSDFSERKRRFGARDSSF